MKLKTKRYAVKFSKREYLLASGHVGLVTENNFPKMFTSLDVAYNEAKRYVEKCECVCISVTLVV